MSTRSNVLNGLLIGVYVAVGLGLTQVWRMHQQGGASFSGGRADAAARVPEATPSPTGEGSGVLLAERHTTLAEAGNGSAVPGESRERSRKLLPNGGRPLALVESPPSTVAEVRERQKRIALGDGASLDGLLPFPADNPWNRDVSRDPVDPMSEALIRSIGWDRGLHPCFGRGNPEGVRDGIPYVVVSGAQPKAPIEFVEYPDDSDPGPYPIPAGAPVEGAPGTEGDRHVIVVDRDNWKLYELFRAFEVGGGWKADSGAIWDLRTNSYRPAGLTSADAAGLPIFPGLVRYDEVEAGAIRHALRFTVSKTRRAYVPPASHWASRDSSPLLPPMGMRVRLKQDYDITGYPRDVQVILQCLKTYGMILADNGSNWFVTGAPDARWDDDALHTLKKVKGSDLEVLRMDGLVAE